jgi:hypothetical protein
MTNPMLSILTPQFKQLFNNAIDAIVDQSGLTIPCTFQYASTSKTYCNNCVFDPITQKSSNEYNGTGDSPFPENSICPVCGGMGLSNNNSAETIYMSVIFDSRYWIGWNSKTMKIPDGSVQTICKDDLLSKIKNTNYIYFNNDDSILYNLAGPPQLAGLSGKDYLICMWNKQ